MHGSDTGRGRISQPAKEHDMTKDDSMDRALDAALEMTFPASDPIAVYAYDPRSDAEEVRDEAVD
jgi:hypothetical protein